MPSHKTSLREIGEFGLIRKIQDAFPSVDPSVLIGIGDDAAVVSPSRGKILLMTTDTLKEGIHFSSSFKDPYSVGWKALAVSLSDIAAMGGIPRFLLLSLSLPRNFPLEQIDLLLQGIRKILLPHHLSLIGGNISGSAKGLGVDTVLIGEVEPGRLLRRSGASLDDLIYVTGTLGDAAAGLELLRKGAGPTLSAPRSQALNSRFIRHLTERHLRPVPRLKEGRFLSLHRLATAAIDISDGLLQDLSHICSQSRVGARIDGRSIPLSSALRKTAPRLRKSPLIYALSGGEDYEILFTVKPKNASKLETLARKERFEVTRIGKVVHEKEGIAVIDLMGKSRKATPKGFDHFRASGRR